MVEIRQSIPKISSSYNYWASDSDGILTYSEFYFHQQCSRNIFFICGGAFYRQLTRDLLRMLRGRLTVLSVGR